MKKFFLSLLTENSENISVGSTCILILIIAYVVMFLCAFFLNKKVPVTGYELGSIVGALYAMKKIPQIWENKTPIPNIGN